jgi:hypothetical protein
MPAISEPKNEIQERFNALCEEHANGRPDKLEVKKLLQEAGTRLNGRAFDATEKHLRDNSAANPWHVCFAVGLCWGHLARLDLKFSGAVARLLNNWNDDDLALATSFYMERGAEPIRQSLVSAHGLFQKVNLPTTLSSSLSELKIAQDRWLGEIIRNRPRYFGNWNATAMFMIALFGQRSLADTMKKPELLLPPGGPITAALSLLNQKRVTSRAPAKDDDEGLQLFRIVEDNNLFADVLNGLSEWSLVDVHSGLYILGTRSPESRHWI